MKRISWLILCALCMAGVARAQGRQISGTVSTQDGSPVISATVRGDKDGATQTDENGRFSLQVFRSSRLIVSSIGFLPGEIILNEKTSYSIVLTGNSDSLGGVVVTALGIVRQERSLGYATTQVKSKELVQARPISVVNGLTGKVAGLQINTVNNGLFAPTRVVLRGNRSLTGNNQALVIVDGAIYYNDAASLNPDDIESINVLKGSSAAALYGSDASNGVLVISTKKAALGKPVIGYSSTVQRESVSYMPEFQNEFGSNGGETIFYDYDNLRQYIPYENQQFGPRFNGTLVPLGRPVADGSLLEVPYSAVKNGKRDFFQNAYTTQNNLSFSSGDDKGRFYLSAQDVHSNAVMPGDFGNRDVFRVGAAKTYGVFSAEFSVAYTSKYSNVTNTGSVYNNIFNTPQHVPLTSLKDWEHNKFAEPSGWFNDFGDNPYFVIANNRNKTQDNNLAGNLQLNARPFSWLSFSYRASVNYTGTKFRATSGPVIFNTHSQTSDTVIYANRYNTGRDTVEEGPKFNAQFPQQATYKVSDMTNFLFTSDFLATVNHDLNKDFNLNITLGASYINNQINYLLVNAGTLFFPVYNVNSLTGIPGLNEYNRLAKKLGYFADATLGYKGFAFVHGSYRTDIDSRLSSANRYIPYYSVDGSLVISDLLPALKESNGVNYAKLRIAHSLTGNASALSGGSPNIADGAYSTVPTLGSAAGFPFNGLGGFLLNTVVANPDIRPETITENEIGLELGLFHDRLTLVADVYRQHLKDGIVYAQTARSSGFDKSLINAASTRSSGLELELHGTILRSRDLTWTAGLNYTHLKSKVLSINGDVPSVQIGPESSNAYAVVGYPYPVIGTGDWTRDPQGHVIVDPITGNPSLDPNLRILGNANPTDVFGFTSSITWKFLSLSGTADYRTGYKVFNSIGSAMDFGGISKTSVATERQRFVFPNSVIDEGNGKYVTNTNITTDDADYNFWGGSYLNVGSNYVTSGSVFKLREVSLRYQFPKKWFSHQKLVQEMSFSVSGRNLIMIRPKTNIWSDPEFSEDTGNPVGTNSVNQAPPTRIFGCTLSVRL